MVVSTAQDTYLAAVLGEGVGEALRIEAMAEVLRGYERGVSVAQMAAR